MAVNALRLSDSLPQPAAPANPAENVPSPGGTAFLNHLRFVAMGCRVKPRTTLFEACALLQADRCANVDAHAEALMRCLGEALGKSPRLHAPGTDEQSFDERWLVQLGRALSNGDHGSADFLLGSRIRFENRRLVRFLVGRIAECFSKF